MYTHAESYTAESAGIAIGRRQGYSEAVAKWQRQIDEEWQPLVDSLKRERDNLSDQVQRFIWAFNSILTALESAMPVLRDAPEEYRVRMMGDFAKRIFDRANQHHNGVSVVNGYPWDNASLKSLCPETVSELKVWWDQALAFAKSAKEAEKPSKG